ncbi:MAG TPA: hypothetical protein VGQ59_21580 [Cyclobacteriaceae bacterium]|jgi:hypothetical protein|nr:hypothetical protein [Cyclobacteriaceae bacterium]
MEKADKFNLIVLQILIGLGSGLIGALLLSSFEITGWNDIYGTIIFALIGGYLFMFAGVGATGYFFLKKIKALRIFSQLQFQSLIGLIVGIGGLFFIAITAGNLKLPNFIINSIAILFPLIGTIVGFNFRLSRT